MSISFILHLAGVRMPQWHPADNERKERRNERVFPIPFILSAAGVMMSQKHPADKDRRKSQPCAYSFYTGSIWCEDASVAPSV